MAEFFVVQSFSPAKRGMKPDLPVQATSIDHARLMAERLATVKPMVFATVTDAEPDLGDFGEPRLICAFGDNLPEEVSNMQPV